MSEIFVPDPADSGRPVDYVSNPLRVQLPETHPTGRPYARLDLIALANNIVARETECRQLTVAVIRLEEHIRSIELRLREVETGPGSGKLARMLSAIADIEDEYRDIDD